MNEARPVTPARARRGKWPKVPPGFVQAVLAGHSALGLVFAAIIYLVCLTGTVAVLAHEFQRWESPNAPILHGVTPDSVQRAVDDVIAREEGTPEHIILALPDPDLPRLVVTSDADGTFRSWVADADGRIADRAEDPFTDFLTTLHINLHLPGSWGGFIVGLTGVALLSLLISGVLAHPRIFRDAFHLRWGGSRRLQEADLHNRMGIWALPFHVLVSLTGALLGLTTLIVGVLALALFQGDAGKAYDLFLAPHPADDPRPASPPDLRAAFATLESIDPDGVPNYVFLEHPFERGQSVTINTHDPARIAARDSYLFDGSGTLLHRDTAATRNLGEQIFNALAPLHFGWFGSWPVKIAYVLLGFALTWVTASGVTIWLARRRDRGRATPAWERIWTAWLWSQPVALAAAALIAVLVAGVASATLLAIWAGISLLALLPALGLTPERLSRTGRAATGLLLVAAGIAHLVVNGIPADTLAAILDAVLIAGGLALALTARRAGPATVPA